MERSARYQGRLPGRIWSRSMQPPNMLEVSSIQTLQNAQTNQLPTKLLQREWYVPRVVYSAVRRRNGGTVLKQYRSLAPTLGLLGRGICIYIVGSLLDFGGEKASRRLDEVRTRGGGGKVVRVGVCRVSSDGWNCCNDRQFSHNSLQRWFFQAE